MPDTPRTALTPAMRGVLIAVAAVVVAGIAGIIWLLASGGAANPGASGPTPSSSTTRGPLPGATPTSGSEVLPPTASAPNRLPTRTPATPLVSAPLPASGSKEGGLVTGFPAGIMGPIDGSEIISSSIATDGDTMQVGLVARTDAAEKDVRAHYERLWGSLGLHDSGASSADPSYVGPYESLTLAVSTSGTGTQYSVHGVFRTK